MNLSKEQLEEVERLAGLFYPPKIIASNIEVDEEDFEILIKSKTGDAYSAYIKGWLRSDFELRKSIMNSALNGSNPAQQQMCEYQKEFRP